MAEAMSSEGEESPIRQVANRMRAEENADVLFINHPMGRNLDDALSLCIRKREKELASQVWVILVTEGGQAEAAYRACRALHQNYDKVVAVVAGWCKSAGTLFCIGAHDLILGEHGELGPIDVQLRRADEIGERDSGLAIDAAFDGLSEASFKLFSRFMLGIKEKSRGAVTFRTAADIAAEIAVGLVAPIFAQLDPIKVGETHRSVRVAEQYARRLSLFGQNMQRDQDYDAIDLLVRGYPSHGFCVDALAGCGNSPSQNGYDTIQ